MEIQKKTVGNLADIELINPVKRFFVGLILWVVSIILKYFVFSLSFIVQPIYYFVFFKWKSGFGKIGTWFFRMALSNDQSGNVQNSIMFQLLFTKKTNLTVDFGGEDDTISYVLARNERRGTLTKFGYLVANLLDLIDKGHLEKSIFSKIDTDVEAKDRLDKYKYWN